MILHEKFFRYISQISFFFYYLRTSLLFMCMNLWLFVLKVLKRPVLDESTSATSLLLVYFLMRLSNGDLSPADGTDRSISWAQQSWRIRQDFSSGALPVIIMANVSSQLMCILECCSKILTHSHFPDPTVTVHGFSTFGRQRRYSEW